jgi:hypothetical protein
MVMQAQTLQFRERCPASYCRLQSAVTLVPQGPEALGLLAEGKMVERLAAQVRLAAESLLRSAIPIAEAVEVVVERRPGQPAQAALRYPFPERERSRRGQAAPPALAMERAAVAAAPITETAALVVLLAYPALPRLSALAAVAVAVARMPLGALEEMRSSAYRASGNEKVCGHHLLILDGSFLGSVSWLDRGRRLRTCQDCSCFGEPIRLRANYTFKFHRDQR